MSGVKLSTIGVLITVSVYICSHHIPGTSLLSLTYMYNVIYWGHGKSSGCKTHINRSLTTCTSKLAHFMPVSDDCEHVNIDKDHS
jgi:hypothetical protein